MRNLSTYRHWLFLSSLLLMGLLIGWAPRVFAGESRMLVLGVIATADPSEGVALIKHKGTGKTFAARVGDEIERDVKVMRILRKHVWFRVRKETIKVAVGDFAPSYDAKGLSLPMAAGGGIERDGSKVRVSAAFRDHIVKQELSKVLMQAAAVPYYSGGQLLGFRLWEIDPGSVYEKAGFKDGDIVTRINDVALDDVGMTIKMLHALKTEASAQITLIRNGLEETLEIEVM